MGFCSSTKRINHYVILILSYVASNGVAKYFSELLLNLLLSSSCVGSQ
jgi:hypothetical protein